jgi:hypothetical protein
MEKARAKAKLGERSTSPSARAPVSDVCTALTSDQRWLYLEVKNFVLRQLPSPAADASLVLPAKYPARDRRFLATLADDLRLSCSFDEFNPTTEEPLIVLRFGDDVALDSDDEADDGAEARVAVDRVLAKYDKAPTMEDVTESDIEDEYARKLKEGHDQWKREYYHVRPVLPFPLFAVLGACTGKARDQVRRRAADAQHRLPVH